MSVAVKLLKDLDGIKAATEDLKIMCIFVITESEEYPNIGFLEMMRCDYNFAYDSRYFDEPTGRHIVSLVREHYNICENCSSSFRTDKKRQ